MPEADHRQHAYREAHRLPGPHAALPREVVTTDDGHQPHPRGSGKLQQQPGRPGAVRAELSLHRRTGHRTAQGGAQGTYPLIAVHRQLKQVHQEEGHPQLN